MLPRPIIVKIAILTALMMVFLVGVSIFTHKFVVTVLNSGTVSE